jgi:hypothetical protein
MTTTETTEAEQVARSYAATIRALEDLAETYSDYPSAETLTEMAAELAAELAEHPEQFTLKTRAAQQMDIDQMRADAAWITDNLWDHEEGAPYAAAYVADILEITYHAQYNPEHPNRWEPEEVRLLVAYGGPTVRVIWNGNGNYLTVAANWWADNAEIETYAPHLAQYLEDLAEGLA